MKALEKLFRYDGVSILTKIRTVFPETFYGTLKKQVIKSIDAFEQINAELS